MRRSITTLAAIGLAAALTAGAASAQDRPQRNKVGTLDCDISGGIGMIVGSQKGVQCVFTPSGPGRREVYTGTISKFGLDIGATTGGRMVWSVFASTGYRQAALAGNYAGASGEATVGAGLGANVLVGGNDRTITLQPLSIQGQTGLNLAVGVSSLELRPVR
jgi:hypothetical protein